MSDNDTKKDATAEAAQEPGSPSHDAPATAWTPKKGAVTRVRIPLPSELAAQAAAQGRAPKDAAGKTGAADPFCRAENEDDDGYDPYSDRRETVPFFERDPWS